MSHWTFRLLILCVLLVSVTSANAQEWARFRGPNGSGQSDAKGIPTTFSSDDYLWNVKLPGVGHSSPVLWGDRVFLISADPKTATRYVLCLNAADGKTIWSREYKSDKHHLHSKNTFASASPAVDADRIYVAWSTTTSTTLMALDHDGQEQWTQDLGDFVSMHGFGTSPMLYKDLVVLPSQQQAIKLGNKKPGKSFVVACQRTDGKIRWKTPRDSSVAAYCVPCLYQPKEGDDELIFCSQGHGICSMDPVTGKENWSLKLFELRTVASPILVSGLIIGSTGHGAGGNYLVAVQPGKNPKEVYRITRSAPYVPTPVAKGDMVFLWYDKGIVTCINAPDGKEIWQERVGGNYSGSPVRVGDRIYCISEDGEVVVLAADKTFKELHRHQLPEGSYSTPAVVGNRMFLRTFGRLIAIGEK